MRRFVCFLVLFVACSPYGGVKNLDSRGSAVIAFGDSLTAGYGAGEGEDWPSRVSASTNVAVINAGVSGDTTEGALARLDDDVLARDPRIVIVGLGGNDYLRGEPLSSTETNLRGIVRKIHARGAMVILLGFRFPSLNADYEAMYERVAEEEGCLLVEGTLKGILTDAKLKSDQIHPNAAGYALMAERIAGPLRKLIAKANA
ncbi:MAG TPA: arylesterase [Thermoanaerobaculia bacterium]